jgi:hypothetical protein
MNVGTLGTTPNVSNTEAKKGSNGKTRTVLQTARVHVHEQNGKTAYARLLFDTGADTTYESSALVNKTEPVQVTAKSISYASFGGDKPSPSKVRNVYTFRVHNRQGGVETLKAIEVKTICAPLHKP